MPNWCSNQIILSHKDKSKIDALLQELAKGDDANIFNHFLPIPADQQDNWYNWCVQNWGTKWDATVNHYYDEKDQVVIDFDTAWGPALALYEELTENGWNIEAAYFEPGIGFVGQFISENGVVTDNNEYSWDYEDEKPFDHIPATLVEWSGLHDSYQEYVEANRDDEPVAVED